MHLYMLTEALNCSAVAIDSLERIVSLYCKLTGMTVPEALQFLEFREELYYALNTSLNRGDNAYCELMFHLMQKLNETFCCRFKRLYKHHLTSEHHEHIKQLLINFEPIIEEDGFVQFNNILDTIISEDTMPDDWYREFMNYLNMLEATKHD